MEPPHRFVRETSAAVVHHADYLQHRDDHALCGVAFEDPTTGAGLDSAVCADCEARLVEYHLVWWRERAQTAEAELEVLRRELSQRTGTQPAPAKVVEVLAAEETDAPKTLLDHARRELMELCRQFDDAVPYYRLKATMQGFSDKLSPEERVLLAQEIGGGGSLIRWSTTEAESSGWQVSNSPVHGEVEAGWEAWTEDSYQSPKKNKWRLGRSRSHDAS